ncbi:MAG TPA: citrate transporter [Chloroflexi bacterium]|nr:citrate transporter [Chloroflexota bacterium]
MKGARFLTGALLLGLLVFPWASTSGEEGATLIITGRVVDSQEGALEGASIKIRVRDSQGVFVDEGGEGTKSQADGSFLLALPSEMVALPMEGQGELIIEVSKASYATLSQALNLEGMARIGEQLYLPLGDLTLVHRTGPAFFIATFVFLLVFGFISFRVLHETIAALMGAVAILGVSYLLGYSNPDFWILSFERAVHYIDFNVIFLIMGMMIFVAIMGRTGVFQWLGYQAYRVTGGNAWYLAALLTIITAVGSAFLNNVTIMLLVAPVTIEMALVLGVHPFSFLIPEVLAANIGGAATLIGDPPNTLIGSYTGLGFLDFLLHMGPMVMLSMVALLAVIRFIYGKEYAKSREMASPTLLERLREDARITDPGTLRKALIMGGVTLVLFFVQDLLGMPPSVVALLGATGLLVWVRPNIEDMLQEVDWTTLVFFMGLFIVVGGIEEVGLIQMIAQFIGAVAGGNLALATVLMLWVAGVASSVVDNIPFTAAALPIAAFLSRTIPGAENNVLYWALAVGACFGGNGTVIASAPNIVTAGMADRAGYHLSFSHFLRVGLPTTLVTILVAMVWILIRY